MRLSTTRGPTVRAHSLAAVATAALLLTGTALAQGTTPGTTQGTTQQPTQPPSQPGTSQTLPTTPPTTAPDGTTTTTTTSTPGMTTGLDRTAAQELMGKTVIGEGGEELGEVEDVILDPQTGEASQLVVARGGFLGIGKRSVAIDFTQAQVQPGGEEITVAGMTRDQLREMPEFEYSDTTVSLSREPQERIGDTQSPAANPQGAPGGATSEGGAGQRPPGGG